MNQWAAIYHRVFGCFSQFTVLASLPTMRRRGATRSSAAFNVCEAPRGGMAKSPKKILCIEDDRDTAQLIAEELTERGFEVMIANDGPEGFVSILKGIPDLVLCDISLPSMSGFEILERLNELSPRLGHTTFIFLTALSGRDNELRARRLGADDYVTKPIDFDILETIIN